MQDVSTDNEYLTIQKKNISLSGRINSNRVANTDSFASRLVCWHGVRFNWFVARLFDLTENYYLYCNY